MTKSNAKPAGSTDAGAGGGEGGAPGAGMASAAEIAAKAASEGSDDKPLTDDELAAQTRAAREIREAKEASEADFAQLVADTVVSSLRSAVLHDAIAAAGKGDGDPVLAPAKTGGLGADAMCLLTDLEGMRDAFLQHTHGRETHRVNQALYDLRQALEAHPAIKAAALVTAVT